MKRIHVDADLCQGSMMCAAIAPDAVDFDADDIAHETETVVADDVAARLESSCPGMAISYVGA